VPAGIIGGRIYFDITTPEDIPHVWYGAFAVWSGGLGIWGGVALATFVGVWRLRRMGLSAGPFANAIAPGLLVAQAVGRIGNYTNKELFGKPSTLSWALQIPPGYRPPGYETFATFQPTFLYELIWDLALAAFLVWLGHHAKIKPWSLFALYVAGYSGYRIFEETIRIDSSEYILGLRLNMFVAVALTVIGLVWFVIAQRRPERPYTVLPPGAGHEASPDAAAAVAPDAEQASVEGTDQEAAGQLGQEAAGQPGPEEEGDGPRRPADAADAEADQPSSWPGA
jgi:prolipoprotein diacylglyceryl transferase